MTAPAFVFNLGVPAFAAGQRQPSTEDLILSTMVELVEFIVGTQAGTTSVQGGSVEATDLQSSVDLVAPEFDLDIVPDLAMNYGDAVRKGRALRWLGWPITWDNDA